MVKQQTLDVIFSKQTESIFKDKNILNESYIPPVVLHRDQTVLLAEILKDTIHGDTPSDIILYGKTGTGKTLTAIYTTNNLLKYNKDDKIHIIYLNLKRESSELGAICALNSVINKTSIKRRKINTGEMYEILWKSIEKVKGNIIIVLDEIDSITDDLNNLLYNLLRPVRIDNVQISLILISNTLDFTDDLDERVKSSLGRSNNILFPPYDANQLKDILLERAKLALKENVLDEIVIPLCAAVCAQEHGDARRTIQLLREAALIADRDRCEKITEKHINQAIKNTELSKVYEGIVTLPLQSKIVLAACINFNLKTNINNKVTKMNTGEHYKLYKEAGKALGVKVLKYRRVYDLINELDMLGILDVKLVSRGRRGLTSEITMNIPDDDIINALSNDEQIQTILPTVNHPVLRTHEALNSTISKRGFYDRTT